MKLAEELNGKKILIWGFGREGQSTLRFISSHCSDCVVDVADSDSEVVAEGIHEVIATPLGTHPNLEGYDYIFKSPGIPLLGLSHEESKRLTSQTQMFMDCYRDQIIGITGTKGKSTTASLTAHILSKCGKDAILVGNIGLPCFDFADRIREETIIVFELSCHQLEQLMTSPRTAVILNLYPDHLDHYETFDKYAAAKLHIFTYQMPGDRVLVNEQIFCRMGSEAAVNCSTIWQALNIEVCVARNENASEEHEELDTIREVLPEATLDVSARTVHVKDETFDIAPEDTELQGLHNVYNISVVYYLCHELYGVERNGFFEALKSFEGLPHRLMNVGTFDGVTYYDDSISTVCETAIQAVNSIENATVLIVGGMDRGISYTELVEYLPKSNLKNVLLLPDTGKRILSECNERFSDSISVHLPKLTLCRNMADAVSKAAKMGRPGEAVVLSPAAASYGFYKDFAERGDDFARLVKEYYGGSGDEAEET